MQFDAALVREQGVEFAVVAVKPHAVSSDAKRQHALASFGARFPGVPIVLMAQDARGVPTYWGRRDIVGFLANVDHNRLPWRRFAE
ncbi:MAG: hypothetical protein KC619_28070 [Myxococcales bacterium]|nr:hypothetical protein [Myxococcales bacterium]